MKSDYEGFKSKQLLTGSRHRKSRKDLKSKKLIWLAPALAAMVIAAACIVVFSGGTASSVSQNAHVTFATTSPAIVTPDTSPSPEISTFTPSPTIETIQPTKPQIFLASGVKSDDSSYVSTQLNIKIEKIKETNLSYFVVELYCKNSSNLQTVLAKEKYGNYHEAVSVMAGRHNAVLAINGDYYCWRNTGVIIRNGQLYRDKPKEQIVAIYPNNEMKTYLASETTGAELKAQGAEQAFSFGPALLKDGKAIPDFKGLSNVRTPNPRTAIGQIEPGHYIIIVVNGRGKDGSKGMTMEDLAEQFEKRGCKVAYNLDGGGSATLYFMGHILNSPTDGHERNTIDSICFIEN